MAKFFARVTHLLDEVVVSLRESFFRSTRLGNLVGLLLGAIASVLLLAGEGLSVKTAAIVFSISLVITMALFVIVSVQHESSGFGWGPPVTMLLGFGLGALAYRYRSWMRWLWDQIRRIDQPHEWALVALFLIGVMLGAFIVRIWPKDQEAFIKGLSGILGHVRSGLLCEDF
jgi:hypothetical protein